MRNSVHAALLLGTVLLTAFRPVVHGQRALPSPTVSPSPTPAPSRHSLWRCELPAGIYSVAIPSIVSVSRHEYNVDAAARVTEVNIDTTGSMTVRFYFLEPSVPTSPLGIGQSSLDKAQEIVKEALDRTGQADLWRKVVKHYPTTTHARTVEYRLESKAQLDQLFESADKAFRTGSSGTYKVAQ